LVAAQSPAGHLHAVPGYCVPVTTIVVGRFAHFAPAIRRHAGHMALIAAVGLRLVLIAPHLDRATICVIGRCRRSCGWAHRGLRFALSFVDPRLALWAFVLNFAGPLLRRRGHRAAVLD
jgi:hypothetical protein